MPLLGAAQFGQFLVMCPHRWHFQQPKGLLKSASQFDPNGANGCCGVSLPTQNLELSFFMTSAAASSAGGGSIGFSKPPQRGARSVLVVTAGGSAGVIKIWRLDPGARSLTLEHQFVARNGTVTSLAAVSSAMPEELTSRQPTKDSMALVNPGGLMDDNTKGVRSGTAFSFQGVTGVAPDSLADLVSPGAEGAA